MNALHLSTEEFRSLADRVTQVAADFLEQLHSARSFPVCSGEEVRACFDEPIPEHGMKANALDALAKVIALSRAPSPRFYGYVLGSGEPVAALADLLASVLNQNVTAWRSAPAAVTIERQVLRWLASAMHCEGFTGSFCGGGSSANLMALAMAREAKLPGNEAGARPGVIYASSEVHMSVPKAVALLGLGRANLRSIPVDAQFRMRPEVLREAVTADLAAGRKPIAVVATAGTVTTGSIDPIADIAAVCRAHDLWLHVDGAYGALAALTVPERFDGIAAADSLSLDAHKWLYQPLDCGILLFKDATAARTAFSFTGEYARTLEADPLEAFAFFEESLELSRRFRALKLWLSLRYHGLAAFRAAIRADLEHARQLAETIRRTPELELLAPVALSAVCFRCRDGGADLNELNAAILRRVIARGHIYLSNASVDGRFALRACFVNHRTTAADVAAVVPEVLSAARDLRS
ncbi:MAG TPA: aminotransferase class V-fold PLP-dependent enzyme [Steroidobacteraceae bacterium]|nr:aminotransferase class V-fold PLP-dependent enzyme [Steroidobacteraceae bacterium]